MLSKYVCINSMFNTFLYNISRKHRKLYDNIKYHKNACTYVCAYIYIYSTSILQGTVS